jgi:hypothetical protein
MTAMSWKAFLLHASALTHLHKLALGVNYDDGAGNMMVSEADVWRISRPHGPLTRLMFHNDACHLFVTCLRAVSADRGDMGVQSGPYLALSYRSC